MQIILYLSIKIELFLFCFLLWKNVNQENKTNKQQQQQNKEKYYFRRLIYLNFSIFEKKNKLEKL